MKKTLKRALISVGILLVFLLGFLTMEYSLVLIGVDIPTSISRFFNPPNTADDSLGWNLMLVNYENYIPNGYKPKLSEVGDGHFVDNRIYDNLKSMLDDAEDNDVYMKVVSGYRTSEKQNQIMRERIISYKAEGYSYFKAKELAEKWVAQEGTSEHQLGLAVDINQDPAKCSADKVYDWLDENATKYGFIKRYPSDKVDITKISNEPWHYRYVGVKAAEEMKEKNFCLEEYIEYLNNKST